MFNVNPVRPTQVETTRNVQTWNLTQSGKLILCNGYKGQSKLFIQKLHGRAPHNKRRGLWDIFTTTRNPIRKDGIYVCRIIRFQIDQKGNPHLLVEPLSWLGTNIHANSPAWKFVFDSNDFASDFTFASFYTFDIWNTTAAYAVLEQMSEDFDQDDIARAKGGTEDRAWEKLAVYCLLQKGIELITSLGDALNSMPPEEETSVSLLRNPILYQNDYPLTVKVFNKWRVERQSQMGTVHVDEACRFIKCLLKDYDRYELESEGHSVIARVEAVLGYYEKSGIKPDRSVIEQEDSSDNADYDESSSGDVNLEGNQDKAYDGNDDSWAEECGLSSVN